MKDEKPGVYPFTRGIYSNMYKNIIVTILTIILLTLWQIDLIPFILPAIMILYLIKIVLKSCDQMQFNILLLLNLLLFFKLTSKFCSIFPVLKDSIKVFFDPKLTFFPV